MTLKPLNGNGKAAGNAKWRQYYVLHAFESDAQVPFAVAEKRRNLAKGSTPAASSQEVLLELPKAGDMMTCQRCA